MHNDVKPAVKKHTSATPAADNQGEGDTKSAERFNREEQNFVKSDHGRELIDQAGQVDPSEQQALEDAERDGLSRTKGDDPAVTRKQ